MTKDATPQKWPDAASVILIHFDDSYWVLQGEDDLSAVLAGEGGYPTPVFCVSFNDLFEVTFFLEKKDVSLSDLWGVHPNIVARMKDAGELCHLALAPMNA